MGIIVGLGVVVGLVVLVAAPCLLWSGIERSLDDEESDRDRTRECRQMLSGMETTKGTKGHEE